MSRFPTLIPENLSFEHPSEGAAFGAQGWKFKLVWSRLTPWGANANASAAGRHCGENRLKILQRKIIKSLNARTIKNITCTKGLPGFNGLCQQRRPLLICMNKHTRIYLRYGSHGLIDAKARIVKDLSVAHPLPLAKIAGEENGPKYRPFYWLAATKIAK